MAGLDLTTEIVKTLQEYSGEVMDKVDKAVEDCGKGMRKDIAAASPNRTGKYKKGWRCEITKHGRGNTSAEVHNKTRYQLTHLLEDGHKSRRKRHGRAFVDAIPHISEQEERWTERFTQKCEEACKVK